MLKCVRNEKEGIVIKRLGIFVFYDNEGIVDRYVEYLLMQMKRVLSELIIVVNGELKETSLEKVQKFSSEIIRRENKGYDGGAYKDVILDYVTRNRMDTYDELVLFNDTFYGPFFPMEEIFSAFANERIDFWGLSRGVGLSCGEISVPDHVQAYFIVIKKDMLHRDDFWRFWKHLKYPTTHLEAILNYEIAFSTYFSELGYKYKTWIDIQCADELLQPGINIYLKYPCELIKNYRFPVLKRKAIYLKYINDIAQLFNWLEEHVSYDRSMVFEHLDRVKHAFSFIKIQRFAKLHKNIYIYGHGECGNAIKLYLETLNIQSKAFVVTRANPLGEQEISIEDLNLGAEDGIIVALGEKNFSQVERMLKEKFRWDQLLMPNY